MNRICPLVNLTILLLISLLCTATAVAQNTKYSVRYSSFMSSRQPLRGDDSIKIIQNGITTIAPLKLPDSISVETLLGTHLVEGDKDSAVLKRVPHKPNDSRMFYKNGAWFHENRGEINELELQSINSKYEATIDEKMILGYKCTKVIITHTYDTLEAWITAALPATLTPAPGYANERGAILELKSSATFIRFVAQEVVAIK